MKHSLRSLVLAFIVLAFQVGGVHAQWVQTNGPYGGAVQCFATKGADLFAGTRSGGVFRSSNNGSSWAAVNTGLTNTNVHALAVSGNTLLAGTGEGLFRSLDSGASWTAVSTGPTNQDVRSLAVSGTGAPGTHLFAGTLAGGVFRSSDHGATWTAANSGLATTSQVMNGNTVQSVSTFGAVHALAVSGAGATGTTLFAAVSTGVHQSNKNGIFRSTDNGATWIRTAYTPGGRYDDVARTWHDDAVLLLAVTTTGAFGAGAQGPTLFAGTELGYCHRSSDNGAHWTPLSNTAQLNTNAKAIHAFAVSGTTMFFGTKGSGVLRGVTPHGGGMMGGSAAVSHVMWLPVNTGLAPTDVLALAVSGTNLFAGTRNGVFRSADGGGTWTSTSVGLTNTSVRALAASGAKLFAGTHEDGVFRSLDHGSSWSAANSGLTNQGIRALAVTKVSAGRGGDILVGTDQRGLFRSTDNAGSWTQVMSHNPGAMISSLVVSDGNIYAGMSGSIPYVFHSSNSGSNWTSFHGALQNGQIRSLASAGANLYAATSGGVARTGVGDTGWTVINTGLADTNVRALAVSAGGVLYAGTAGGVFRSNDGGASWSAINAGLTNLKVQALAVSGPNVFAGTTSGVFQTDNGISWTPIHTGLGYRDVHALLVSGPHLYAGTDGCVWRRPLAEITSRLARPEVLQRPAAGR